MMNWIAFVLTCMIGLTGCAHTDPSSLPASGSYEPAESLGADLPKDSGAGSPDAVKPDAWTLDSPPDLVVSTLNNVDSVIASCGNFTWTKKLPGGSASEIIACGMHPLDEAGAAEHTTLYTAFPAGTLPPLDAGEDTPSFLPVFYLNFGEVPPETVTVRRWPSEYIGRASEFDGESEEVDVDSSDGFAILPLGDGAFVYEVHAGWGEVGSAHYVFSTLPQVREDVCTLPQVRGDV